MTGLKWRAVLAAATALTAFPVLAQETSPAPSLEMQFRDPPNEARPRVWWHWMNGNITEDGIAKDMAWMKRVGIGGMQNFDADLMTPQIVEKRLVYMTPEWKHAFRFAATEADRLGLELAIAASPGWSETGGPWVKPEDGLKKLVWSESRVSGGKPIIAKIAAPPSVTGPYQAIATEGGKAAIIGGGDPKAVPKWYSDVAVLAVPVSAAVAVQPKASFGDGTPLDLMTTVAVPRATQENPSTVVLSYARPQTIRSARLHMPGAKFMFSGPLVSPSLEASDDGKNWRLVAAFVVAEVPTTVSFIPVKATHFRLVLKPETPSMSNANNMATGIELPEMLRQMGGGGGDAAKFRISEFSLSAEARIDQAETKAGYALTRDYFALPVPADGASGADPAQVIDLTSKLRTDGSLDWTPPKGNDWRIIRMGASLLGTTNHPAPPEATGLEVDKYDGPAVRRYLEHYLGMYRDAAGADMIGAKGVRALLTDSIEVGAANWTPQMVAQFKKLRGYDPTPWMPALTGVLIGTRAQSDAFLYDYRRTLADLMASEHYGTVAKVAHENGLKVYGEALEDNRPSLGDDMAMRRHADVPMAAMWTHSRASGPKPSYLADIKGAASVAHIYGQNLVAAESMTSMLNYWNDSPATLKRIIDLEFVTGVNRPVIHTSVHQPIDSKVPGLSLLIFGQFFNRHEAWGEMAKPWVDYLSRNALMLQQGRNVADVGYFYGEEAPLTGLYGEKRVADAPKTRAYDFVNYDALVGALTVEGNELSTPGGARYRALYLGGSSRKMSLPALRKLAELADAGATIVGFKPEGNPGMAGDAAEYAALVSKLWGTADGRVGKGRVIPGNDIDAALTTIGVAPDFRFSGGSDGAEIPFLHRKLADGDSYYLVNRNDRAETIEARFRVTGKAPELWHTETGTSEAVSYRIEDGETIIPLSLGAEQSVHVVFRKPAVADSMAIKKLVPGALATLDGPWNVAFQAGRGAPATVTMPGLAPLNENADPGIKYFSGIATYTKQFTAPRGWKRGQALWIDLGNVRELAEVSVNGKLAGSAWHAPYRIDIGAVAKPGRNTLSVRVANLWVNRLVGDAQKDAQKITFTALPTYRADAPLKPSGLIGPVQLLGQGK